MLAKDPGLVNKSLATPRGVQVVALLVSIPGRGGSQKGGGFSHAFMNLRVERARGRHSQCQGVSL